MNRVVISRLTSSTSFAEPLRTPEDYHCSSPAGCLSPEEGAGGETTFLWPSSFACRHRRVEREGGTQCLRL